ncbi:hypothetical protein [Nonomuraea sp. NPDC049695]|uniref:aromatic-ring hydroxylase C-terminal domain-containing protein n=1 Tax=Nonomuraea sp. NPDC049695 TaxID=3154734 RepID=UPI0034364BA8
MSERRQLINLSYRLLGSLADAEDVVQDTYDRWPAERSDLGADAVLIRPDGHVAWVARAGERPDLDALRTALTTWLGPADL